MRLQSLSVVPKRPNKSGSGHIAIIEKNEIECSMKLYSCFFPKPIHFFLLKNPEDARGHGFKPQSKTERVTVK